MQWCDGRAVQSRGRGGRQGVRWQCGLCLYLPYRRGRKRRYRQEQRYIPLAVTSHCTSSCTEELAGKVAMVSPVVNSAVALAATGVFNAR